MGKKLNFGGKLRKCESWLIYSDTAGTRGFYSWKSRKKKALIVDGKHEEIDLPNCESKGKNSVTNGNLRFWSVIIDLIIFFTGWKKQIRTFKCKEIDNGSTKLTIVIGFLLIVVSILTQLSNDSVNSNINATGYKSKYSKYGNENYDRKESYEMMGGKVVVANLTTCATDLQSQWERIPCEEIYGNESICLYCSKRKTNEGERTNGEWTHTWSDRQDVSCCDTTSRSFLTFEHIGAPGELQIMTHQTLFIMLWHGMTFADGFSQPRCRLVTGCVPSRCEASSMKWPSVKHVDAGGIRTPTLVNGQLRRLVYQGGMDPAQEDL